MRRFDWTSFAAGLALIALGCLLLLDRTEAVDLRFGYLWPALLAAVGAVLLASGLSGRGSA
jgi:LiaI-LiaF-like transmembrane region